MTLEEQLMRDEGVRAKPYTDTVGKLTIGVGRNLTDVGLADDEIRYLLSNDIKRVRDSMAQFQWFSALDDVRQGAILNLAFNVGVGSLLHFPHLIAALAKQDWTTAAAEMKNSVWATQVGPRAVRLEQQILTGEWV